MLYRVQLIPKARPQRPGYLLWAGRAASLTVHNTANPNATAANHADYFGREDTKASAHIFVDDREAVMTIPLNEHAWHAGITAGNATSIGIEVCEFSNRARQDKTDANAQRLIADMLTGKAPEGWNVTHLTLKDVRTHQSWKQYGPSKPGKYCPRMLLPWWDRFVSEIGVLMNPEPAPTPPTYRVVVGWSENKASLDLLKELADELGVKFVSDGPVFYVHANLAKTKILEARILWDRRLHRFNAVPTDKRAFERMGRFDGIEDGTPWKVTLG